MTREEAHKRLDEAYRKNEIIQVGIRRGKIPESTRVAAALIATAEIAKSESSYFSMPKLYTSLSEREGDGE